MSEPTIDSAAPRRVRRDNEPLVAPLSVRPKQAWRLLGISKSLGFQLLASGVLERIYLSKRAVGVSLRSIEALAEGRGIALPPPEPPTTEPEPSPTPTPVLVQPTAERAQPTVATEPPPPAPSSIKRRPRGQS